MSKISVKGKMEWLPCTVLDYDVSNHSFTIQFRNSKKLKIVSRLNVRFLRENVDKFNRRVAVARNNMAKYEAQLRFDAQIDMMPITELPSLAEIDFVDIHNRIGIKLMGKLLDICNSLDDEVKLDFKKLENRFEFEYNLEYNPLIPNRDEFLALREPKKPSPNYGLVCRPSIDFRKMLNSIKNSHLMAEPILQDGLFNVWNIFQNTQSKIFYTNGFPNEILTLDEYINKQKSLLNESSAAFKKSIQETLENVVVSTITNKSNSLSPENYDRFKKMVIVTIRMFHTVLLRIVQESVSQFLYLFEKYDPNDEMEIEQDNECFKEINRINSQSSMLSLLSIHQMRNEKSFNDQFEPQFIINLIYDEKKEILESSPSLEDFHDQLSMLMTLLEQTVDTLPNMKSKMIDVDTSNVSFADCQKYIEANRPVLTKYIDILFNPVSEFISSNRSIEYFLYLNPKVFVKKFDPKGNQNLDEYRDRISDCQNMMSVVQTQMNHFYKFGLFKLSCEDFKVKATNHLNELITQLLTRIKKFAISTITEVRKEYDEIFINLKKSPTTPEELGELNLYIKNVRKTEKIRTGKMGKAKQRFSFLDEYHFAISNEEIALRYQTMQMPTKIETLIEEIERSPIQYLEQRCHQI